jgi:hypothetical protein
MFAKPKNLLLLLLICSFPVAGYCGDNIPWGDVAKKTRTPVPGTSSFYEPDALNKDDKMISFKMYSSYDAASPDQGVEYKINCETQEYTNKEGDGWKKPEHIVPGEQLYPFLKKVCELGPGFFGRMKKNMFD